MLASPLLALRGRPAYDSYSAGFRLNPTCNFLLDWNVEGNGVAKEIVAA
jgi:hypothetical protein